MEEDPGTQTPTELLVIKYVANVGNKVHLDSGILEHSQGDDTEVVRGVLQSGNTEGDVPHGGDTDGDVPQSDNTEWDVPQGDNTEAGVPQGDNTEGDVPHGDNTDGDVPQGDNTDGDVPHGDMIVSNNSAPIEASKNLLNCGIDNTNDRPLTSNAAGGDIQHKMRTEAKGKNQDENLMYIFTCPFCLVRFKDADELKIHLKSHVDVKSGQDDSLYRCGECERSFENAKALESHMVSHSDLSRFKCEFCQKSYSRGSSLVSHMKVHNANKCEVCKKYFTNTKSLREHQLEHGDTCTAVKTDKTGKGCMSSNVATGSLEDGDILQQVAPNMVTQSPNMATHSPNMATQSPNKVTRSQTRKNQCSYCDKTFLKQSKLVNHMRTHTGEKPFSCTHCPKAFARKSSWVYHERIHSGEKPCHCKECGKTFAHPTTRNAHAKIHLKMKAYSCIHCGQKFKSRSGLNAHLLFSHTDSTNLKCSECSRVFKNTHYLNRHIKAQHGPGKAKHLHRCGQCGETFVTNTRLASHMFMHEQDGSLKDTEEVSGTPDAGNSRDIKPDVGLDNMGSPNVMQEQSVNVATDGLTKCDNRRIDSDSEANIVQTPGTDDGLTNSATHDTGTAGEATSSKAKSASSKRSNLKCDYCIKVFRKPSLLQRHQRIHTGEKPYVCEYCPKAFARKDGLLLHERGHTGERPYQCKDCHKTYKSLSGLKDHIKSKKCEKSSESKSALTDKLHIGYKCQICYKDFTTRLTLIAHRRKTHDGNKKRVTFVTGGGESTEYTVQTMGDSATRLVDTDRPADVGDNRQSDMNALNGCKYCNAQFQTADLLQDHEQGHVRTTGKKSHKCGFCDSTFVKKCSRIAHERVHTGEKPFQCNVCSESFARRDTLKHHQRIHSVGEGLFQCNICSKSFARRDTLENHQRIHSADEKTYQCKKCDDDVFSHSDHLGNHEDVHTASVIKSGKMKAYVCQYCQQSFKRIKHLVKHLKTKHDGSEKDHESDQKVEDDTTGGAPEGLIRNESHDAIRPHYKCNQCDVRKRTIHSVELHERTHADVKRTHVCQDCDKRFVREDALKWHESNHGVFECDMCMKTFKTKWHLTFHRKSHAEKKLRCPVCGEMFQTRVLFKAHKKTHSAELWRYFYCTECPKSFGHKKSLADHVETCHRDSSRVRCEHCGETFVNQGWFQKHMYINHHEVVFAQQQLRVQGFPDLASMQIDMQEPARPAEQMPTAKTTLESSVDHMSTKESFMGFSVQSTMDCIQTLTELSSLTPTDTLHHHDTHKPSNHSNPISSDTIETPNTAPAPAPAQETSEDTGKTTQLKWFPCKWCEKKYNKPSVLKIHERSHTGEKPYLCKQCGKAFRISSGLKAHEERHQGVRKHNCTECSKSYANASALQEHMDAHKGIKRYKCLECPKSFRQQQSLREHLDVHKGFRKYQCDDCPRSFSQRRSWRNHVRTHGKLVALMVQ